MAPRRCWRCCSSGTVVMTVVPMPTSLSIAENDVTRTLYIQRRRRGTCRADADLSAVVIERAGAERR